MIMIIIIYALLCCGKIQIQIQIQIQIFIDTLAAESRITCYEQKCLKTTKMTHNKSIGTDTHTYTDIY